jgi:hypothetical protein
MLEVFYLTCQMTIYIFCFEFNILLHEMGDESVP